jgi:hypothetical protein
VIEEIDVMVTDEMIEIEAKGIIETEETEVDMNTGIGNDMIMVEEVEDHMIMMIEGITRGVVEGKMMLLSPWAVEDIGIGDHVGMRMLLLNL